MGVTKEQSRIFTNGKTHPFSSEQFEGKRLLERQRMVNGAVAEEMKEIHVLFITKAVTPEQWKQQQESEKSQAAA